MLYALGTVFPELGPSEAQLDEAMQGHVLTAAKLIGTYGKKGC